jgi:MOSC domain-containing protein YiiM
MKVLSVNVGMPRIVEYMGEPLATGIFKRAVEGRVAVGQLNLAGDAQADLSVHGGPLKSVYVYPSEHYAYWRDELPDADLPFAVFGENLTTEGILETDVRRGDRLSIGTALFEVTIPRYPCYKLGIRFGRRDILKRFMKSGRSGFYLTVIKTGELAAGDSITFNPAGPGGKTISEVFSERGRANA